MTARSYVTLAVNARNRGDWPTLAAAAEAGLAVDPENAWLHAVLAEALKAQGDPRAALAPARRGAALAPEEPLPLGVLALTLIDLDCLDEATEIEARLQQIDPESQPCHVVGCTLAQARGDMVALEGQARAWFATNPADVDPLVFLATSHDARKRHVEAETVARTTLRLDPERQPGHFFLGRALLGQQRFAEARAAALTARRLDPTHEPNLALLRRIERERSSERMKERSLAIGMATFVMLVFLGPTVTALEVMLLIVIMVRLERLEREAQPQRLAMGDDPRP